MRGSACIDIAFFVQREYVFFDSRPWSVALPHGPLLPESYQRIVEQSMKSHPICSQTQELPWNRLMKGAVFLCAVCIFFVPACVPLISTQQKETRESSSSLIKPTLQDRPTEDTLEPTHGKGMNKASQESGEKNASSHQGLWKRIAGVVQPTRQPEKPSQPAGLIKPILSESSNSRPTSPLGSGEDKTPKASDAASGASLEPGGGKTPRGQSQSARTKGSRSGKEFSEFDRPDEEDSEFLQETQKSRPGADDVAIEGKGHSREQAMAAADDKTDSLRKHDHSKYVTTIRHKAIDMVNKETDCDVARLCRDSLTDEWSLALYFKAAASYFCVIYTWDEIEGRWEKSFTSEKRPLSGMKKHLAFSSAGKSCRALKGGDKSD
ncbi:MAG: hypothetical protein QG577_864 [Thermodesulfobacteriota bacterium]|nr:hypothetical protein [Thermodesulfobacteriota bacterium]